MKNPYLENIDKNSQRKQMCVFETTSDFDNEPTKSWVNFKYRAKWQILPGNPKINYIHPYQKRHTGN